MTLETDGSAFKMWAQGVVGQLKDLRTHVDIGLGEIRSAILQLALTDAEVMRLKEDTDDLKEDMNKLKKRTKALEDAEIVRTAKLDTIKSLNKWMLGVMISILIGVVVAGIRSMLGI